MFSEPLLYTSNLLCRRARISSEDGEVDDGHYTQRGSVPPLKVPTRTLPRRAALVDYSSDLHVLIGDFFSAAKKPVQPISLSSDSEGLGETSSLSKQRWVEFFTVTTKQHHLYYSRTQNRSLVKDEEGELDKDINKLLGNNSFANSETTYDSIMGPDSEDEEGEVNDLLAE